jgi:thiol-disulfide isomerase/thioredoxin
MRCLTFFIINIFLFDQLVYAQPSPQHELDSLRNPFDQRQEAAYSEVIIVRSQIATTKELVSKKGLQDKLDSLGAVMDKNWDDRLQSEFAFVQRHRDSPLSLEVLGFNLIRPESIKYYSLIDSLYAQLSERLQNTLQGKRLFESLTQRRNSEVGMAAPSFTVRDLNGQVLSLKDFYNKNYVLIDFWASWCLPCREEFPYLKQAYAKYQNKGFEIISASTDDDLVKWKTAIYKDSIDKWRHFSIKENTPKVSSLYFIIGVPIKILIDKQGRIIDRWVGYSPENTQALESKLENLLNSSSDKAIYR